MKSFGICYAKQISTEPLQPECLRIKYMLAHKVHAHAAADVTERAYVLMEESFALQDAAWAIARDLNNISEDDDIAAHRVSKRLSVIYPKDCDE